MTNEERDLIARFIARVGGAPQMGGFLTGGGSVPSTQSQPPLPPIDREADAFIGQQFQQYPEARYRITQTAVVTEAALAEAQNRIKRLEWELEQTKNAAQQAMQQQAQVQAAPQPQQSGGFFSSIFGSGQQRPAYAQPAQPMGGQPMGGQPVWGSGYQPTTPPPQPQYAPGYQPGMFQRGGSGFLGSALTTAAGVAGGMVVGNALMGMFEGHHGGSESFGGSGGFGGGAFGGTGGDGGGSSPWGAPAGGAVADASSNPFDGGGVLPTSDPTTGFGSPDSGYSDPFAGSPAPDNSWDQASSGFDDAGGGGFDGGGFDDNNA